jgi:uncharacterized protein DUF5781
MRQIGADRSLQDTLAWAIERMKERGYEMNTAVNITVDPALAIMGYAKEDDGGHTIVISEWALDSEMLGGLVLHELAHIYFTEKGARSHNNEILDQILREMKEREGLRAKETEYLIDSFNHLQNILVDDIVFDVMQEREQETTKKFFTEWVSERPSNDPVMNAAMICRNAFATASLKRRNLFEKGSEIDERNKRFLSTIGGDSTIEFDWLEGFLEGAKSDWDEKQYRAAMGEYFERIISIMRSSSKFHDLR